MERMGVHLRPVGGKMNIVQRKNLRSMLKIANMLNEGDVRR
jgi:hypothetical protein